MNMSLWQLDGDCKSALVDCISKGDRQHTPNNRSCFFTTHTPRHKSTGGNRAKLPSWRWRRRGRSLREVFARSRFFATTDLSLIYNRETWGHGTPCAKTTDSYRFSFMSNNPRKIRRETTVGENLLWQAGYRVIAVGSKEHRLLPQLN